MSDVKATSIGCCDGSKNNWLECIMIMAVIYCLLCGNNIFGSKGGCC